MKKKAKKKTAKKGAGSKGGDLPSPASRTTKEVLQDANRMAPLHRWTFLTNHAHVLALVHVQPDLVLRQVALRVGITERAVQRIIQDLEESGYLVREKVGRRNRYQVVTDQPLRHPIEAHRNIGDLLRLVAQ